MSSTDEKAVDSLARSLFDEVVAPLAEVMRGSRDADYFALRPDPAMTTYFEPPSLATMSSSDLQFPGGGTAEGLVDALAAYWRAEGEVRLADMAPRLMLIAEALQQEAAESGGDVDILCYTMF